MTSRFNNYEDNYLVSLVKCDLSSVKCDSSSLNCDSSSVNHESSSVNCDSSSVNHESSSVNCDSPSVNCELNEDEEEVKPKSDSTLLCLLVLAGLGYYMYVQKYTYLE